MAIEAFAFHGEEEFAGLDCAGVDGISLCDFVASSQISRRQK